MTKAYEMLQRFFLKNEASFDKGRKKPGLTSSPFFSFSSKAKILLSKPTFSCYKQKLPPSLSSTFLLLLLTESANSRRRGRERESII